MKKVSPSTFGGEGSKIKLSRKGRKARGSFYHEPENAPEFDPSNEDWKEIERAYGNTLHSEVRTQIKDIADDYLWFFLCDKNKPYADDAVKYLEKVKEAAFPPAALAKVRNRPAHTSARDVLLEYYLFNEELLHDDGDHATNFLATPDRIKSEAKALADDIRAFDMDLSKKKPVEWDKMAVGLMLALQSFELPYTINKRGTKKGASPIVKLMHELQDRFPPEFRLHVGSDGEANDETLATAGSAAWVAYQASPEGRRAAREKLKSEKAKREGREYKILERHERLNKVLKYLALRRRRNHRNSPMVATSTKEPS